MNVSRFVYLWSTKHQQTEHMNIFVGSLNFKTTDSDLEGLFSEYGKVQSAVVIMDRATQRSKGFGFVDMPDDTEAQNAIDNLNGAEFMGRKLVVNQGRGR